MSMTPKHFLTDILLPEDVEPRVFPRLDLLIILVASVGGLVLVAADFYQRWIAPDPIKTFNIDGHNNPETWFHAAILTGAALSALAIGLTCFGRHKRWLWVVLGIGIAFFSMDKTISLHELVGAKLQDRLNLPEDGGRVAWEVAWFPILVAMVIVLFLCVRKSNRRTKLWTLGLFAGGACKLVLEALTYPAVHYLHATENNIWFYGVEVDIEESVQLLAFACLFAGFAQLFVDRLSALARGDIAVLEAQHRSERLVPFSIAAMFSGLRGGSTAPRRVQRRSLDHAEK